MAPVTGVDPGLASSYWRIPEPSWTEAADPEPAPAPAPPELPAQRPRAEPAEIFGLISAAFLGLALIRGGSSADALSSHLVALAAVPVLTIAAWRLLHLPGSKGAVWPSLLLLGALAVPLLQLIPLPPDLWRRLQGRQVAVDGYRAAGMALPWLPVSLTPAATWGAVLALLPGAAMFAATLSLNARSRQRLAIAVLASAVSAVVLGALQLAGGGQSSFRLYDYTDATAAVGYFANRNHQGVFLAACLPLAALVATTAPSRRGPPRIVWIVGGFAIATVLVVGVAAARSRAGVLMVAPGLLGALAVAYLRGNGSGPGRRGLAPVAALFSAAILAAILVLAFDAGPLAKRFEFGFAQDLRYELTPTVIDAGVKFSPLGSGVASFQSIYPMFEKPEEVSNVFVNHAHNDYAEIWLEAGWPGLGLIAAFILWWAFASYRILKSADRRTAYLALAGSVIVGLFLVHSGVDYPLRTPALAALFAFGCGLMTGPPRRAEAHKPDPQT